MLPRPGDPDEVFLVHGDELVARGDPRGELVQLHHRKDRLAQALEQQLAPPIKLGWGSSWRLGYVETLSFGLNLQPEQIAPALAHPSLAVLAEIGCSPFYLPAVLAARPGILRLHIHDHDSPVDVGAIFAAIPGLEQLVLDGPAPPINELFWIAWPRLSSLSIRGVDGAGLAAIASSPLLPRLRKMTLCCGSIGPVDLRAVARGAFAHLEMLELWNNHFLTDGDKAAAVEFHPRARPGEPSVPASIFAWLRAHAGAAVSDKITSAVFRTAPGGYTAQVTYTSDRDPTDYDHDNVATWTAELRLDERFAVMGGELTETHRGEAY